MDLGAAVLQIAEANGLTQSNVRQQLSSALCDAYEALNAGSTDYYSRPWLVDIVGDDAAGFVIYSLSDDLLRAPYTISVAGATRSTSIAISQAVEVMPRTTYDLSTAVTIESQRESQFTESIEFLELPLKEASTKTDYKIKVIQAGKGSSAFYPKEVLQRDGPKVFTAGTKMYWNHPTRAEESSRPEGDLNNLAAVLTSNAYWDEGGAKGPGLYASAKVFADFAGKLAERADNIGVSIRAYGEAESNAKTGLTLKNFTRAESVDFVTEPGAGGAVLTESARAANQETTHMDEAQVQAMITESMKPHLATIESQAGTIKTQAATLAASVKRANLAEARAAINEALQGERLPEPSRKRVCEALLARELPVNEAGDLDAKKLGEAIVAEVKSEAEYLSAVSGKPVVTGMGATQQQEAEVKPGERTPKLLEMANRNGGSEGFNKAYSAVR